MKWCRKLDKKTQKKSLVETNMARTPKFLIWLNYFFGFCVFQFNYPITGKRYWKDFCLNLEKDTMSSFGIRLHLNKAYPEISRGVDVTFTTKWQSWDQRNTAYPNPRKLEVTLGIRRRSWAWHEFLKFCQTYGEYDFFSCPTAQ